MAVNPLYRAHRSTTVADVYAPGKWNTHLPDDFAAMALAHHAIEKMPQPTTDSGSVPKDGTVRLADRPFNLPSTDAFVSTEGGIVVVDERYDPSTFVISSDGGSDLWESSLP